MDSKIINMSGGVSRREGSISYDFTPSETTEVHKNIKYITFRDSHGTADTDYYYQQRWNSQDHGEAPVVRDLLDNAENPALRNELFELFRMEPLLDEKIILLSNGELRKFHLIKALITNPLDEPLHGLDTYNRSKVKAIIEEFCARKNKTLLMVTHYEEELPPIITNRIFLKRNL